MATHKTIVGCGLSSLGTDPKKQSYQFVSIFKANRPSDDVVPDYDGIMNSQKSTSSLTRLMNFGLWSRGKWQDFFQYKSDRQIIDPVPIKANGKYYGDGSFMDDNKGYVIGFIKALGGKPFNLIKSMKNQNKESDYQHMAVVWGIPANTQDKFMLSVLFDTLNNARIAGVNSLGFDADQSREQLYICEFNSTPQYERGEGTLEGFVKDDCKLTYDDKSDTCTLIRQTKSYWEKLYGWNIQGKRDVHDWRGDNSTPYMYWENEMNKGSTGLFVPITFDDIKYHQRLGKVTPLTNLAMLLVTQVKVIHIPWYAQSWFKWLLIVVVVIISVAIEVFTLGLGTAGVMAADSAIVGGLTTAAVAVLGGLISQALIASIVGAIVDYLIATIVMEAVKEMLKPLVGKKLANLLGGVAGAVTGSYLTFGAKLFQMPLKMIQGALNVADSVQKYVFGEALSAIQKKQDRLDEWQHQMDELLGNKYQTAGSITLDADELNPLIEDPVSRFQFNQRDVVCQAAVLTGYDIAQIQFNQIRDHYKNGTSTPL